MLRLEAEAITLLVDFPCFALESAIQEVAAVELNSGLCRVHRHHTARLGFGDTRGQANPSSGAVHNEIVVVTFSEVQLLIVRSDTFSNRVRPAKVEWSSLNFLQFAYWD